MAKYEESKQIYQKLAYIKQKRQSTSHPDYAHLLINLASINLVTGEDDKVAPLLKEAIEIYENKFGKGHQLYASAIRDLGNFLRYKGRLDDAFTLVNMALSIQQKVLGENHPDYVKTQEDLAVIEWKRNNYEEASQLFDKCLNSTLSFVKNYFPPMSEAEKT